MRHQLSIDTTKGSHPLRKMKRGERLRIASLEGDRHLCRRLREMGIRETMPVEVVLAGWNMVCVVCGSRFALGGDFADCIYVERVA